MAFVAKDWKDFPDTNTPITAAALEDLETRVTDHAESALGYVNAIEDGATGDGVTDDTAALQASLVALSGGGVLYLPAGTYRVATTINVPTGVTVQGAGMGATIILLDDAATPGVTITGSEGSPTVLTGDLDEHDLTADLTSATGIVGGDMVMFRATNGDYGKWVTRVLSVATNTLTLTEPSPTSLTVANGASCREITAVRDVRIADLTIETATATPASRADLVKVDFFDNVTVERVAFRYATNASVRAFAGRRLTVRDCRIEGVLADDTALNVDLNGVTGALVASCDSHDSSCGVTLEGCPRSQVIANRLSGRETSGGRGVKLLARSNYSIVDANVISGFASDHTAIHQTDSWGCVISANEIDNCGTAINMGSALSADDNHHTVVRGNVCRNITGKGISIDAGNGGNGYIVVDGNTVDGCTEDGIYVDADRNIVRGNTVTNFATGGAFGGITVSSAGAENLVAHNIVIADGSKNALLNNGSNATYWLHNYFGTDNADSIVIDPGDTYRPVIDKAALSYSASMTPNLRDGSYFTIAVTNGTAMAVNAPSRPNVGAQLTLDFANSSGGALGAITWNGVFKLAGAFTNPANAARRTITFRFDDTNWVEIARAAADIT